MRRNARRYATVLASALLAWACAPSEFAAAGKQQKAADHSKDASKAPLGAGSTVIPVGDTQKVLDVPGIGTKDDSPIKKLTSSDPNIASIDDKGNIKGVSPGEATVTVTFKDGTTQTVKVKVTPSGSDADDATGGNVDSGDDTTFGDTTGGQDAEIPGSSLEDDGLKCDKGKEGLVGKVYKLAPNTAKLPDFKGMTPVGQVETLQLDVPDRDWQSGFPAIPNLIEWFAIEFFGQFTAAQDGSYQFRTASDDGSKLYIDNKLVLDNDGIHATTVKDSAPVQLKKGKHKIEIEWFQGPRVRISLQVYWKPPGASDFTIIPAKALTRNLDCDLQKLGKFP